MINMNKTLICTIYRYIFKNNKKFKEKWTNFFIL